MRVPLSWLREFVPVDADPGVIAERLTMAGLQVEEVVETGSGIAGVVVGRVLDVRDHPNADNLVLVGVDAGEGRRDIVCGARNFGPGDLVPVALPGAKLPGGAEIGARVVRGERSDGMLCSARELEISDDHSGILVVGEDAPLGEDVRRALALDDVVFDIDVLPNRPDAMSVAGVGRDVAALFALPLTIPEPVVPDGEQDVRDLADVRIEDARGCPRYCARVITGVTIRRSPWWMRRRLMACGVRPISNVVDVTNYVLLERGHPLHAFDLETLAGRRIVVRRPRRGERLRTLDGEDRELARGDVTICDAERPVAVAGIMGGGDTEVGPQTTDLLLESAYFDAARIAATARRLGLRTEASVRFERGADPEVVPAAAARAAALIAELAGGTVARGEIDAYPRPVRRRRIPLRASRASALLGIDTAAAQMEESLRSVGCAVESARGVLRVEVPSYRPDIVAEEDLLEEIARLYGYERIPATLPGARQGGGLSREQRLRETVHRVLLGAGASEARTVSLLPPWIWDRLELPTGHGWRGAPRLANPLSEDESVLRPSLLPGLLLAAQRNAARGVRRIALFESGPVFSAGEDGRPAERWSVAWVLAGAVSGGLHEPARTYDFFDSKGALEALMSSLGVATWWVEHGIEELHAAHPGRSGTVHTSRGRVGAVGELHPRAARALDISDRVAFGTLDLATIFDGASELVAREIPRFPGILRDIAVIVPDDTPAAAVELVVTAAAGPLLESLRPFDVYRGDPVPAGSRSIAFSLTFRNPERTLADADIEGPMVKVLASITEAGWSVRA